MIVFSIPFIRRKRNLSLIHILPNLIDGGAQERGHRAGTENIAAIVGLGVAIETACADIPGRAAKLCAMRDRLIAEIPKMERVHLNGDAAHRLPGNVNFAFEGVEGEALLLTLDAMGICASSGSACTSGSLDQMCIRDSPNLPRSARSHDALADRRLRQRLQHLQKRA